MPSKSNKQKKFMQAVAHNPKFAKKVGVPVSVGKEFSEADKKNTKKKFGRGSTRAKVNNPNTRHGKLDMPYKSLKRYTGMVEGGDVKKAKKGVRRMQDGGTTLTSGATKSMAPPSSPIDPRDHKVYVPENSPGNAMNPTMPDSVKGTAPTLRPNIPPAPSDRMAGRQAALEARGNMGRGMDMRRVPTLPTQASQRARDMMAGRMPITTPGGPTVAPPLPEAMPTRPLPETMPTNSAVLPTGPLTTGFNKGGRIKKMARGGSLDMAGTHTWNNPGSGKKNPKGLNTGGRIPSAPSLPSQASSKASAAMSSRFAGGRGMNTGGRVPTAPRVASLSSKNASPKATAALRSNFAGGMNKGGAAKVRKYAAGGSVKGSSRGDGCCMKGKTKGRMC